MKKSTPVKIGKRTLELTNVDKVLYPKAKFTKGEMIDYYARVAKTMLPYIESRPVTMKRYPEGVEGQFFYEKECPKYRPAWMHTATVQRHHSRDVINYCTIDDIPSLVWVVNLASIELHVLLAKKNNVHCPTTMAFDFDPGPGMTILDCAWAATELRQFLKEMGLECFPKTSGKKGIHVYVPLNQKDVTFEHTKTFAHETALALERRFPDRITSNMKKDLRTNKIFIDWSQNDEHKTTAATYSLRVNDQPTVSTPVTWDELTTAMKKKGIKRLTFTTKDVLARIEKLGDLFAPVLTMKQRLPKFGQTQSDQKASSKTKPTNPVSKHLLKTYNAKRDFSITPEPQGGASSPQDKPLFVIQKHAASHLHYDFRLEADGVLKSWAVPKGPSTHPEDKRLAMRTEDHPMDYADFEGTIPKGEYGGGTVMVWDKGTYVNLSSKKGKLISLQAGLAKGHIDFWLQGKKLNGGWSLIRMGQDEKHWLLVKMQDEGVNFPPNPVRDELRSAKTDRTLEEIEQDHKSDVWHSNRAA
jgi:bifunctional non-homologous end joining protein LigD